jgi:hypothetical protein
MTPKRITFNVHQEPDLLGFLTVEQMLADLTVQASTTEVLHRAIRLLHRQSFASRYQGATPNNSKAILDDFALIASGIRIPIKVNADPSPD